MCTQANFSCHHYCAKATFRSFSESKDWTTIICSILKDCKKLLERAIFSTLAAFLVFQFWQWQLMSNCIDTHSLMHLCLVIGNIVSYPLIWKTYYYFVYYIHVKNFIELSISVIYYIFLQELSHSVPLIYLDDKK